MKRIVYPISEYYLLKNNVISFIIKYSIKYRQLRPYFKQNSKRNEIETDRHMPRDKNPRDHQL